MRDSAESLRLTPGQSREADRGRKTLVPFHGRPFLEYLLGELADGGVTRVCIVVGPDDPVRTAAAALRPTRISIDFAVQPTPEGTAHALAAAGSWARARRDAGDSAGVLVVNADNLYPAQAIRTLIEVDAEHATIGFRPAGLVTGTITPERLSAFAFLQVRPDGCLESIVEKPEPEERRSLGPGALVSMTLWRFGPGIFEACRSIARSERGEFELPDAVMHLVRDRGCCVRVRPVDAPVLDLTRRKDIPVVESLLAGRSPRP